MILAFDSYYTPSQAKTVCIKLESWTTSSIKEMLFEIIDQVEPYEAGAFYKRELPGILSLLKQIDLRDVEVIIVDGFVFLDDEDKEGLGAHLYKKLNRSVPVVGVAKNSFQGNTKNVVEVYRGQSKKPLFVTSVGIDLHTASLHIQNMAGANRMPEVLKLLDMETKKEMKP